MNPVTLVTISFAPGVFWLWYFARWTAYRPNPRRLIALTFVLGMISALPAALIEGVILRDLDVEQRSAGVFLALFFVVGPVEEIAKFLAVRLWAYRSPYFDEPMDGLIFAAAASLGFASLENLFYAFTQGAGVILVRGPISTLAHVVFGGMWGLALGMSKHSTPTGKFIVILGLAAAALLHGAFDAALLGGYTAPLALGLFAVGAAWLLSRFEWARRVSPFRYRRNVPLAECPGCGSLVRVTSRYCRFCGNAVELSDRALHCARCQQVNRSDASYCIMCGDQLLKGRR
ncbi:MAG: PrsW family intramembrane metalloprotease [Chloroflexi bacterium]|nr:PrsW family intramembrane metalloprotease [Chloroflexota bacterium]